MILVTILLLLVLLGANTSANRTEIHTVDSGEVKEK